MEGRGSNEATDKIKKLADLEKIEFDVQQDLLQTLKEMYESEKKPGESFGDYMKRVPVSRLRAIKLKNGGSVEEKYQDLIDAFEKGIDVMPGEDLTKYIERVKRAELLELLKDK